jgi:hypothetical protein
MQMNTLIPAAVCRLGAAVFAAAVLLAPTGASAQSASSALMTGLASGLAKGVGTQISEQTMGWAMSSLGLESDPNAEIVKALSAIETTLQDMDQQLANINELLAQQSCSNAADQQTVVDALNAIDQWTGRGQFPVNGSYADLIIDAQNGIDVTAEMAELFDKVLNGDGVFFQSLENLLVGLSNGMLDQGSAEQLISTCGLLVDPTSNEWDDRDYFAQLHNLLSYYFDYQSRAAVVVVEAYHSRAIQAWIAAGNDPNSLAPEDAPQICESPTDAAVIKACNDAQEAYDFIASSLRAQYGEAGASYSSGSPDDPTGATADYTCADAGYDTCDDADPVVQIHNPTGIVWVKDLDDFFAAGGYSTACAAATSGAQCGPGVGTYNHATFEKYGSSDPLLFGGNGGYTTWGPAAAAAWEALTAGWSGSTTLGEHLTNVHHFAGATTARVFFTGDVDTSGHEVKSNVESDIVWRFLATEVACIVAMPLTHNISSQPFCSSGFGNLMHSAADHSNSNAPCHNAKDTEYDRLDDAGITEPFFDFLYNMQDYKCKSSDHPLGQTFYPGAPGWLLQYQSWGKYATEGTIIADTGIRDIDPSNYQLQYHWPAIDSTAVDCAFEPLTGQQRSPYSLNGRGPTLRLCGADFDAWFDTWIVPPPAIDAPPEITTPEPVALVLPAFDTYPLWHHEVTALVDYAHLIEAIDEEDGLLDAACHPMSGAAFQLGLTRVTCSATDSAGNTTTESFEVHVQYPFEFVGLFDDFEELVARAGRTLRVDFSLGGDRGADVVVAGGGLLPLSQQVDCDSEEAIGAAEPVTSQRDDVFDNGIGTYSFLWKTRRDWDGQCRQLVLELVDGTQHTARVQF